MSRRAEECKKALAERCPHGNRNESTKPTTAPLQHLPHNLRTPARQPTTCLTRPSRASGASTSGPPASDGPRLYICSYARHPRTTQTQPSVERRLARFLEGPRIIRLRGNRTSAADRIGPGLTRRNASSPHIQANLHLVCMHIPPPYPFGYRVALWGRCTSSLCCSQHETRADQSGIVRRPMWHEALQHTQLQ